MGALNAVGTWSGLVLTLVLGVAVWSLWRSIRELATTVAELATRQPPARIASLVGEGRAVVDECTQTLEKLHAMALRFAKRDRDAAKKVLDAEPEADGVPGVDSPVAAVHAPVVASDRQKWKAEMRARMGVR